MVKKDNTRDCGKGQLKCCSGSVRAAYCSPEKPKNVTEDMLHSEIDTFGWSSQNVNDKLWLSHFSSKQFAQMETTPSHDV